MPCEPSTARCAGQYEVVSHRAVGHPRHLRSWQVPGLAVILVGSRTDSSTYVRMKKKACAEVRGMVAWEERAGS